jgi:uncharacterized protein YbjT (DUF2867 family)
VTSPSLTALLAGATGLVGGHCLRALLAEPRYERVVVVTRRDIGPLANDQRVSQVVTELAGLGQMKRRLRADHVFCTIGTTRAKAGSPKKFREIDLEYPLRLAQLTRSAGARHYSIVSALGASPRSPFLYSRVKGEVEQALQNMGWPSPAIFRPSLIAGDRSESRPLERLSGCVLRFAPAAYRPVDARDIGNAMVQVALDEAAGVRIVASDQIARQARPA